MDDRPAAQPWLRGLDLGDGRIDSH